MKRNTRGRSHAHPQAGQMALTGGSGWLDGDWQAGRQGAPTLSPDHSPTFLHPPCSELLDTEVRTIESRSLCDKVMHRPRHLLSPSPALHTAASPLTSVQWLVSVLTRLGTKGQGEGTVRTPKLQQPYRTHARERSPWNSCVFTLRCTRNTETAWKRGPHLPETKLLHQREGATTQA